MEGTFFTQNAHPKSHDHGNIYPNVVLQRYDWKKQLVTWMGMQILRTWEWTLILVPPYLHEAFEGREGKVLLECTCKMSWTKGGMKRFCLNAHPNVLNKGRDEKVLAWMHIQMLWTRGGMKRFCLNAHPNVVNKGRDEKVLLECTFPNLVNKGRDENAWLNTTLHTCNQKICHEV